MRTFTRLALSFVLIAYTVGCSSQVQEWKLPSEAVNEGKTADWKVLGVIDSEGYVVHFDEPAALTGQTIDAVVGGSPYSTSLDEMQSLLIQRTDYNGGAIFVGVLLVGIAVAVFIAVVSSQSEPDPPPENSSCPFVYSFDGEVWRLDAEPFGGAITAGLERDDYTPLENLRELDGVYQIRLRNEQPETQYNNLMELWIADHASGTTVFPGPNGELYPVRNPATPTAAVDAQGADLLHWLEKKDLRVFESTPVAHPDGGVRDEIVMTFPRPSGATDARLVADVATSWWAADMLRYSLEVRGNTLTNWYDVVDNSPMAREIIEDWSRRGDIFDLNVDVEVDGEWIPRTSLRGGGPIINETRAVPIDLTGVEGEVVRLRIRPPVGFWALNSFALDYEMLPALEPLAIPAAAAIPDNGVLAQINAIDDAYYEMPEIGDWTELRFEAPPTTPGMERTAVLHSRGYYRIHADGTGEPDLAAIDRITNEVDGLARISVERFAERQMASAGAGN